MAVEFGGPAEVLSGPSKFCPSATVTVQGHGWPLHGADGGPYLPDGSAANGTAASPGVLL